MIPSSLCTISITTETLETQSIIYIMHSFYKVQISDICLRSAIGETIRRPRFQWVNGVRDLAGQGRCRRHGWLSDNVKSLLVVQQGRNSSWYSVSVLSLDEK